MKKSTKLLKKNYPNECYVVMNEKTDYLNYVTRTSTKEQREKLYIGDIFINAAICKDCSDYIRSKNLHDFVYCKCKSIAIDGGSHYQKVLNYEHAIVITEYFWDKSTKIIQQK